MKKLNSIPIEKRLELVFSSGYLCEKMDDAAQTHCNDELSDYLYGIKAVDYSIGMYNRNFMRLVGSAYDFLLYMSDVLDLFGLTEKIERKINQCWKLYNSSSNLFEYEVGDNLVKMFSDYLSSIVKYYEEVSYDIYNKNSSDNVLAMLEYMDFDDVYVREDGRLVRELFLN